MSAEADRLAQIALSDLIEGEMEYILRHHADELAEALYAAGYRKQEA